MVNKHRPGVTHCVHLVYDRGGLVVCVEKAGTLQYVIFFRTALEQIVALNKDLRGCNPLQVHTQLVGQPLSRNQEKYSFLTGLLDSH